MDPLSSPGEDGPSSPAAVRGPGHSLTPGSALTNTMSGGDQGNVEGNTIRGNVASHQQNVVGDHNTPIQISGGNVAVTVNNNPGEKSKNTSEKKLPAVVRDYKQFLTETENTTLRTKLDQLQVGNNKYFPQSNL